MGLFFGKNSNPANAAQPYLEAIPGTITPYYQPYINAGQQALGALGNQYSNLLGNYGDVQSAYHQLLTNPSAVLNQLGSGYQQSPGYQYQLQQGEEAINNAAAAGGMLGTPQQQQYAGQEAENLANQDYNQYLNHVLGMGSKGLSGEAGLYNEGLSGVQGINQMGYSASNSLAEGLAQALMAQANLGYAGQANANQQKGGLFGMGAGMLGSGLGGSSSGSSGYGKDLLGAALMAMAFM